MDNSVVLYMDKFVVLFTDMFVVLTTNRFLALSMLYYSPLQIEVPWTMLPEVQLHSILSVVIAAGLRVA